VVTRRTPATCRARVRRVVARAHADDRRAHRGRAAARARRRAGAGGVRRARRIAPPARPVAGVGLGAAAEREPDRAAGAVGETLLTLYSPELFQTEQEFLIETGATDAMGAMSHEAGGTPATIERLRLLGVPAAEIERLRRERRAATEIAIPSPVTGTVMERGVTEGQYVSADTPLFTIADLSRVWVLADLYEMELGRVRAGEPARFTADALPGRTFESRIEFVYPTVSSESRTVKARLVVANGGGLLRPGMFGRVRVSGRARPGW